MVKAVYFAWVRERIGLQEESIAPPSDVVTVGDLVGWMQGRGSSYAHAFENPGVIRVALDRRHAKPGDLISGAGEIAFFPPMTGG